MSKARDIADLLDSTGDVKSGALDNVPASNDASALTTGTLSADRLASGSINAVKLANDAKVVKVASAPSSPSNGEMYYNTTLNKLYVYDGSEWKGLVNPITPVAESVSYVSGISDSVLTGESIVIDVTTNTDAATTTPSLKVGSSTINFTSVTEQSTYVNRCTITFSDVVAAMSSNSTLLTLELSETSEGQDGTESLGIFYTYYQMQSVTHDATWRRAGTTNANFTATVSNNATLPSTLTLTNSINGSITLTKSSQSWDGTETTVLYQTPYSNLASSSLTDSDGSSMSFGISTTSSFLSGDLTSLSGLAKSGWNTTSRQVASSYITENQNVNSYSGYLTNNNPYWSEFSIINISMSGQSESCCDKYTISFPETNSLSGTRGGSYSATTTYSATGTINARAKVNYYTDNGLNSGYGGSITCTVGAI